MRLRNVFRLTASYFIPCIQILACDTRIKVFVIMSVRFSCDMLRESILFAMPKICPIFISYLITSLLWLLFRVQFKKMTTWLVKFITMQTASLANKCCWTLMVNTIASYSLLLIGWLWPNSNNYFIHLQ